MINLCKKSNNPVLKPLKYLKKNFDKKGIRIDYVKDKNMLLGVNRQVDMYEVNASIKIDLETGIFLVVYFYNEKENNKNNLSRFRESKLFKTFKYYVLNDTDVYVLSYDLNNLNKLEQIIIILLKDIYDIDSNSEIEYYVRA